DRGRRLRRSSRSPIRSIGTSSSSRNTRTRTCTTCSRTFKRCGRRSMIPMRSLRVTLALTMICACGRVALAQPAQGLDPATLTAPPADSWPTYHGDYTGQRHSRLTEITPDNVHQLTLAWAFETGQPQQIKATPILERPGE